MNNPIGRHITDVDPEVRAALDSFPRPVPFDVRAYANVIAAQRGRPIEIIGRHLAGTGPSGIVVSSLDGDRIIYDTGTTHGHSDHIVAHELAHIVLGHHESQPRVLRPLTALVETNANTPASTTPSLHQDLLRRLVPDLPTELIKRILRRTASAWHQSEEQQAETLATLLLIGTASTPRSRRTRQQLAGTGDHLVAVSARARRPLDQPTAFDIAWRRHTARRLHDALEPLWTRLPYSVVANLSLTGTGSPELQLYRRIVEIRDALLLLRPYTCLDIPTLVQQHVRPAMLSTRSAAVMTDAVEVASAIDARNSRLTSHPVPIPGPTVMPAPDIFSEARALLRLDKALSHPMVTELSRQARLHRGAGARTVSVTAPRLPARS